MHGKYPNLFSPLDIGGLTLKNRIIYSSIGFSHFAPGGYETSENQKAFEIRARSGAAVITHPECIVDDYGDGIGAKFKFANKGIIPDLITEAEMIHRYGGIATICLCHHGGRSEPSMTPDGKVYGPSAVVSTILQDTVVICEYLIMMMQGFLRHFGLLLNGQVEALHSATTMHI